MKAVTTAKARGRVFYGWWIVLAGSIISAYGSGVYFYGFSVFFKPMVDEFGWSRAATAGAFSLSRLEGGIEGPIAGWLIDKIGPRAMVVFGVFVTGAGFVLMYWVDSIVMFYLVYGVLLSIGWSTGFTHPLYAAVSNWFIRMRARAISVFSIGGGLGGTIIVPIVAWLVAAHGWRMAALVIGIGMWVVGIPLAFAIRQRPEQYGLLPDGGYRARATERSASPVHEHSKAEEEADYSTKEALLTYAFWVFTLASTLRAFVTGSVVVHEITYLTDLGVGDLIAAGVLSAMTLASLPGRLIFGWLGDYFDKRRLLAIGCVLQAIGLLFFANPTLSGPWMFGVPLEIVLFVVIYGFSYGASIPLVPALRADFFGRKAYATISGMMTPITMIGTVGGPVFAGYVFDTTHSYNIAFTAFAVLFVLSGVVFLLLKPPTKKAALGAADD